MISRRSDIPLRLEDKWLEKSLVAPSSLLHYERSDGEMAASERLIREKAKTERWNRSITKFFFGVRIVVMSVPFAFVAGVGLGLWLADA